MKLYLINYNLKQYTSTELSHIVKATSKYLAERKLLEYWREKGMEDDINYDVNILYCNEIIE